MASLTAHAACASSAGGNINVNERITTAIARSPDSKLAIELGTCAEPDGTHRPCYHVTLGGETLIAPSTLGLRMKDGSELGHDTAIVGAKTVAIHSSFEQFPGKRRHVIDRGTETTVTLRERGAVPRTWQLLLRAYDDGVALRYRLPKQPGGSALELAGEQTRFALPANAVVTMLPLGGFTTSHEGRYEQHRVNELPAGQLMALPLLAELPNVAWTAILEANLTDYAGMYLARPDSDGTALVSRLSPRPDEPGVAVRATLPHDSPWRLILVSKDPRRLIDSDTLLKLNAPSRIKDTSWIRPGKTTFPWWNDFHETGVPFRMGLNNATAKYYIDFCAEHGIHYHTLDGVNDLAWYGGRIAPYEGTDITRGIDGLDLKEVIRYAHEKGVKLRLWMHWQAAEKHMERAFPLYRAWGIEGVMIDFMDRDDQEMLAFQRRLLQLAADNHLTVTFHGVAAPTGLERTFPNLLASEGVRNLEYDKWDPEGVTPEHDVTIPLTRMLAGPVDYHQGTLRGVPLAEFKPRVAAPVVIGTPVRMLATYVVLQNHLSMMADYPSAYRGHPLTSVMVAVPSSWDDTRTLVAAVGEDIAIARRSGREWWIGAMGDRHSRMLKLPLDFLSAETFTAEIYQDDLSAPQGYRRELQTVTSADQLELQLAESGGALVRLRPAASR